MGIKPTATSNPDKVAHLICDQCGQPFVIYKSQQPPNAKRTFCSKSCKSTSQIRLSPEESDIERFWSFVVRGDADECWEWSGARHPDGHGKVAWPGRKSAAISSRIAFEITHGQPPIGMVRHTCDNPPCCNPAHLFLGTSRENNDDKLAKGRGAKVWGLPLTRSRQTHCVHGHEFTEGNTYVDRRGYRSCRTCRRDAARKAYYRNKE